LTLPAKQRTDYSLIHHIQETVNYAVLFEMVHSNEQAKAITGDPPEIVEEVHTISTNARN
jgi:hypothetical protein